MKVRLLVDMPAPNPAFNPSKRPNIHTNPVNITKPVGTEIQHADGWYLLENGLAEPVDTEAIEAMNDILRSRGVDVPVEAIDN